MSKNRIIIPAKFTFEVTVRLDPNNGQTDMLIRNRSGKQFSMWQVVGLLIAHAHTLIQTMFSTGKIETIESAEPMTEAEPNKPNGGDNNAA